MAPKRARVIKTASVDKESNVPATFVSEEVEKEYAEYWGKKAVSIERTWNLDDFHSSCQSKYGTWCWKEKLVGRGWDKLVRYSGICHKNLVREFFANIIEDKIGGCKCELVSVVRNKKVVVNLNIISEIFGLSPFVGVADFSYNDMTVSWSNIVEKICKLDTIWEHRNIPKKQLKWEYAPLHDSTCYNILPQGRTADVSKARARLIYAIDAGHTINIAHYILSHLYSAHEKTGEALSSLPFGVFLTEVILRAGVKSTVDLDTHKSIGAIDHSSIAKSWGRLKEVSTQRQQHDLEPNEGLPTRQLGHQQIIDRLRELRSDFEGLQWTVESLELQQLERLSEIEQRQKEMHYMIQFLVSRHPDWPPQHPSSSSTPLLLLPPPEDET